MYRDLAYQCPQCGIELVRDDARDKWRCKGCDGVLLAAQELEDELGPFGKPLVDEARNGRTSHRPCPACTKPMTSFDLAPLQLDRCAEDGLVWFDHDELRRLAGNLNNATWVQRFLDRVL